ncbi:hypothetical protein CFP65_2620 [Kitasatospora sp. MMS16-BH015]|nr:hypothetical protein CFP65_2620 [Kitasatospora sp. MMS16-BH015]
MGSSDGLGDLIGDEGAVPSRLPFGGRCPEPGPCPAERRSLALPSPTADGTPDELPVAALLLLAQRYADAPAFRLGVRHAAASGAHPATLPASATPGERTAAAHLATVRAALELPAEAAEEAPQLLCVLGGPADGGLHGADLVVSWEDAAGELLLHLDLHRHVHGAAFADRMLGHLARLIGELTSRPQEPVRSLRMLTAPEWDAQLAANATGRPYPRQATIHRLFAEQAAAGPERTAVRWDDGELTYRQLDEQSREFAEALQQLGVRRHSRVALLLDRTPRLVVALLAVLRLGAAYLPLDAGLPAARRDFLLADSGAQLLVTDDATVRAAVPVLDLTAPGPLARSPLGPEAGSPQDTAYVMYTSGTTGQPKGVPIDHRAVLRLVRGTDFAALGPDTRILQTGALAFDATTFEFWGALLNGGAVVLTPTASVLDAARLRAVISRHGVNAMFLTAALFNQLVEQDPTVFAGCRTLVGGEPMSGRHAAQAMRACPDAVFVNAYGPTENTTFSVTHRLTALPEGRVPIGTPIANSTAWVLDREGNPQPVGVPGELYVGGDGLAAGYLNRPELTAAAFLPGTPAVSERLYRTGDLARWTEDGLLDCLGRRDNQVKIRGYRIELDEIEHQLARLPGVGEAVAVVSHRGDTAVLRAFWTSTTTLDPAAVRAGLARQLPPYMVPQVLEQIAALPHGRTLKVDRSALARLPLPTGDGPTTGDGPAPEEEDPLRRRVAEVFAEVLKVDRVGPGDDFFALGGNSLLAMRLWNRLRAVTGAALDLRQVLAAPTVAAVAEAVRQAPAGAPARPSLARRS